MEIRDYVVNLKGMKYEDWQKVKTVVENRFYELNNQNILIVDESVLAELEAII